jgi:hypothetical protein
MKGPLSRAVLTGICAPLLLFACASLPRGVADGVVNRWDPASAAEGRRLIAEYGVPDDVTLNRLTWHRRGPWTRMTASNAAGFWRRTPVYRSAEDLGVLAQTISYPMNAAQTAEVLSFSRGLSIDPARGELTSRASDESLNFLTLNLADEVAQGRATVPEARAEYARIVELTAAGKTSAYTQSLLFSVATPL